MPKRKEGKTSSISTLYERKARLLSELEKLDPLPVAKLRAVDVEIERFGSGEPKPFADIRSELAAVKECLRLKGEWMQKRAIVDELIAGGFPGMKEEKAAYLLANAITKMGRRGDLSTRPHESGKTKDEYMGLPEWESSPAKGT